MGVCAKGEGGEVLKLAAGSGPQGALKVAGDQTQGIGTCLQCGE